MNVKISKRQKFLISSLVLSGGFVVINYLQLLSRSFSIGLLGILTVILFSWSLKDGLRLDATLSTLILPTMYTIGVGIFWFLIPASTYARIPIILIYGFGIYVLCLTLNIYTVSAVRTIALLRAARGVGFVLTLFTFFLLFNVLLSLKSSFIVTTVSVMLISTPLFFQGYWTIVLKHKPGKDLILTTLISSLMVGEVAFGLFFWPVTVVVGSLFLTIAVYMILGLGQAKLEGRLFQQTIREYLAVGVLVFFGMFIATRWSG